MTSPKVGEPVEQSFRDAMRRLAGTVTIVTVANAGEPHGTTATAVTSLSMNPPSLLVCFNRDSRLHALLSAADTFCVNLLHTDNIDISKLFSSPVSSAERFARGDWKFDAGEAPYLANALSSIQCAKDQQIDYGSHSIFIGRVLSARNRAEICPLVYSNGNYAGTTPLP
jgi:flavin reductase (DIM6/NTAB) family NADH-FMN oxidoreductase RutF